MREEYILFKTALFLFLATVWLAGCSSTSPTNIAIPNNPAVNATDTPTSDPGEVIPQVNTCPVAVQMIVQNKVGEVKIYKELSNQKTDIIVMIGLLLRKRPQGYTGLPNNEVDVLIPSTLYAGCRLQVLDAVKQVNKELSKDKQIQVDEPYVPNVSK